MAAAAGQANRRITPSANPPYVLFKRAARSLGVSTRVAAPHLKPLGSSLLNAAGSMGMNLLKFVIAVIISGFRFGVCCARPRAATPPPRRYRFADERIARWPVPASQQSYAGVLYAATSFRALAKAGATSAMKRAISSLTC